MIVVQRTPSTGGPSQKVQSRDLWLTDCPRIRGSNALSFFCMPADFAAVASLCASATPSVASRSSQAHRDHTRACLQHDRPCNSNGYKGQTFASLEESKNAQCQPGDSGQECALLAVYPESRVFSYTDARRYTATVQAKTLFNMTVDGAGNIRQCRTETE